MISHFNSLEFREACLSSETLPKVDALTKLIKEVFDAKNVGQLTEFLTSIAAADGNISVEEQAFIESLSH